eukprot:snap_masked-scaffold191_size271209-processed-gene-0.7 protein:Tk06178 transcript:snap_masked-scaffold191_size271209-processed-gene-0.7-mRNA-1 annotation:"AGAP009693-PA"
MCGENNLTDWISPPVHAVGALEGFPSLDGCRPHGNLVQGREPGKVEEVGDLHAKLETKALKAKRPGFTDDRYNETAYYVENGLRKVYPYYFTFTTFTKGRWVGEKILEVFGREFRAHPVEEYYSLTLYLSLSLPNPIHGGTAHLVPILTALKRLFPFKVHPCGRYRHNTVVFILAKEYNLKNLRTIHRLDRLTSGLLMFGRNPKKARDMEQQIRNRQVLKEYVCRVEGEFPEGCTECNQPVEVVSYKIGVCKVSPQGKECRTEFERLSFNGSTSVVLCRPFTGRMHQIRVHLQYLGFPVINDPLYNHVVFGPTKGKGGIIGKSDDQLIQDLIAIHNAENWLGMDGDSELSMFNKDGKKEETNGNGTGTPCDDILEVPAQNENLAKDGDNESTHWVYDPTNPVESLERNPQVPRNCTITRPPPITRPGRDPVVIRQPLERESSETITEQDNELLSKHQEYRYQPEKMTWDPNCYECKVKYRDPKPKDLVMVQIGNSRPAFQIGPRRIGMDQPFENVMNGRNSKSSMIRLEPSLEADNDVEFTWEDEEQLLDDLIDLTAEELLVPPTNVAQLQALGEHQPRRGKRFTVDFNGMQVSYPTYVRLSRLQAKVVKLQKMIQLLHRRYTPEQLDGLPQYGRLMELYESLRPLLPSNTFQELVPPEPTPIGSVMEKRSFNPWPVSTEQDRMLAIFEHVGELERLMERLQRDTSADQLEQDPGWQSLIHLHRELNAKLAKYSVYHNLEFSPNRQLGERAKRSTKFKNMYVSVPEYGRLMKMQKTALKLDSLLRKMVKDIGLDRLQADPKWNDLVQLRESLQTVLPEDHPEFDQKQMSAQKRGLVTEFNGVQVSYPQYLHLMSLQRKVRKLDSVMGKIASLRSPEELAQTPQWRKLKDLRQSLIRLLPLSGSPLK